MGENFAVFVDFQRTTKVFPMNCLSNGFPSIQMKSDPRKFSLHLNQLNEIRKLQIFPRLTFVVYGMC